MTHIQFGSIESIEHQIIIIALSSSTCSQSTPSMEISSAFNSIDRFQSAKVWIMPWLCALFRVFLPFKPNSCSIVFSHGVYSWREGSYCACNQKRSVITNLTIHPCTLARHCPSITRELWTTIIRIIQNQCSRVEPISWLQLACFGLHRSSWPITHSMFYWVDTRSNSNP